MKFIVEGGKKLKGKVKVQGSKNAAFPVIAATILTSEPCQIQNVPDIADVRNFLAILKSLGSNFEFKNNRLKIDNRRLASKPLPRRLVKKLRGSVLFAGALLSRFGKAILPYPGGDAFGKRPIDLHLDGFRKLAAQVRERKKDLVISAGMLRGNKIVLSIASVTGTENLILAAVSAKGTTEIRLADASPHVQTLCNFLNKMGAQISGIGTPNLKIKGLRRLHGSSIALNPDEIDALTFCVAAAAAGGEITVSGVKLENLDAPLRVFEQMKVRFEARGDQIKIKGNKQSYQAAKIVTGVYPSLLTDYQPLFGVLATQAQGETEIHDWIHEGRLGYLKSLMNMGAKVKLEDIHRAKIYGPVKLRGSEIKTPDLRAGASILIAALVARGKSIIYNAEIIDRGYEKIDERLNKLGANIHRVN